jgi:hypothetical protein
MTSQRKQRRRVYGLMHELGGDGRLEDRQWDSMPAVGREFGSPDFDQLMEEDYRQGRGVFDPALAAAVGKRRMGPLKGKLVVPEDFDASLPDDVLADFEGGAELEVPDDLEP